MERHCWLAVAMPAVLTHKSSVSLDLAALIMRSARTGQAAQDLEALLRELRTLRASRRQVTFYGMQRRYHALAEARREATPELVHFDTHLGFVSDTYISSFIQSSYETHQKYILLWQACPLPEITRPLPVTFHNLAQSPSPGGRSNTCRAASPKSTTMASGSRACPSAVHRSALTAPTCKEPVLKPSSPHPCPRQESTC